MNFARTLTLGAALALGATVAVAQPPAAPAAPQEAPRAGADARRGDAGRRAPGPRAQGPRARGRQGPAAVGRGPLFQGIELSEAQRTRLRAVGERHRERLQALRPPGQQGRARSGAARPDSAARAQRRTQMVALRRQLETDVRGVLTPAQRQTYDANRARMAERVQARPPRDGRGPDGERRGRVRTGPRHGR